MDNLNPTILLVALMAGMLIDMAAGTMAVSPMVAAGLVGVLGLGSMQRWRDRRAFAVEHGLHFRTVLPSDARSPFIHVDRVRNAVLLYNLVEGTWSGLEVRVFNLGSRPGRGRGTWAIVTHPEGPPLSAAPTSEGTGADAEPPSGPLFVEAVGPYLLFSARRLVAGGELATWLNRAVALTRELV